MRSSSTIRYIGDENFSRRYLLEREDGKFWSGDRWVAEMHGARLYRTLADAQRVHNAIQSRKFRGKSKREFRVELAITVCGSEQFSVEDLRRYLSLALRLELDVAAAGDGPNGNCLFARGLLSTVEEVQPTTAKRCKAE